MWEWLGRMKSCENCSTYFITKDAKLCTFFFSLSPFLNAHFLSFFFLLSPSLYFVVVFLFMFCMIYNQTTFLPHVFIQHSLFFCQVCEWLSEGLWKRKGTIGGEGGWGWEYHFFFFKDWKGDGREGLVHKLLARKGAIFFIFMCWISYAEKMFCCKANFNVFNEWSIKIFIVI